jgi:hypothetical protein
VRLARIFPGSGLPPGFARHEAAVAGFLDRHRRRYDVTTDAALAAGRGPRLARYRGVLLAGDTRWLPLSVGLQLRRFVRSRGVLVSLGTGSLRRLVRLAPTARLVQPTAPAPADLFGARLRPIVRRRVNLTILKDRIGLFVGGGGLFSGVSSYEETAAVGPSATLVASAVTPRGHPVIVAARFGPGLVVRTGYSSFAAHLRSDRAVAGLMERMWTLLSR